MIQLSQNLISNFGVPQIVDIRSKLPVNPNYTWAQLAGRRDISALTTIALHHDAAKKSVTARTSDLQLAINIANGHIQSTANEKKGDAGFPYHVWIRSGQIYLCNDILDRVYGVASNNGYTVHVCVSGEYAFTDALTDADRKALYAAIITLIDFLPSYQAIKAHGELNKTDCPGYDYNRVRQDVQTWRMKLQQTNTWEAKLEKVKEIAEQINFMNSLIEAGPDDGNAHWGMNQQLELYDIMKQRGLL